MQIAIWAYGPELRKLHPKTRHRREHLKMYREAIAEVEAMLADSKTSA